MKRNRIVFYETHMMTDTAFMEDGRIMSYPAAAELAQPHDLLPEGVRVVQRGKMVTDYDGTCRFQPYATDGVKRYRLIAHSEYGELKEGSKSYVVTITFPKTLCWSAACRLVRKEIKNLLTLKPIQ